MPIGIISTLAGLFGLTVALITYRWLVLKPHGTELMKSISKEIQIGAQTFLKAEFIRVFYFATIIFFVLMWQLGHAMAFSYVAGAFCSAFAGFVGMKAATKGNSRTANAAKEHGAGAALHVAFNAGAVMGLNVACMGLIGIGVLHYIYADDLDNINVIIGFSMGASTIALFSRLGGGIFTKAADVGADLVGKVEEHIPEDDPRNPGVIADNVGDNVGDVAGLGSDIFETYVGAMVASIMLAVTMVDGDIARIFQGKVNQNQLIMLPLTLALIGLFASLVSFFMMNYFKRFQAELAIELADVSAAVIFLVVTAGFIFFFDYSWQLYWAILAGNLVGVVIGKSTRHYTAGAPVYRVAEASKMGAATDIITGFAVGLRSCAIPLFAIVCGIFVSNYFCGLYGIGIAAVGMLGTTGMLMTIDACGPVCDNAGGIAEMAKMGKHVRAITDHLDAVGNTSAANGKGFAAGAAAFTALSLFVAYRQDIERHLGGKSFSMDITNPEVIMGMFLGAMIVLLCASMTIDSVGKAASEMVAEIRRQFKEIPGLLEGTGKPDNAKCVEIASKAALDEMIPPTIIAIVFPIVVGFVFGPTTLGGVLAGVTLTGLSLGLLMANSGGAWDNAKKYIESDKIHGEVRGGLAHTASVIGDTVGDPFKDTTGPAMNILIKIMSIISLLIIPLIV